MEFIKAEEFLKQSEKVQKALLNWWKPQMYDMFFRDFGDNPKAYMHGIYNGVIRDYETLNNATKDKTFLPILTEGQLRKFIEEKTNFPVKLQPRWLNRKIQYQVITFKNHEKYYLEEDIRSNIYDDPLQAYWQVVIKIAEEGE